jgi:hypothetical protein
MRKNNIFQSESANVSAKIKQAADAISKSNSMTDDLWHQYNNSIKDIKDVNTIYKDSEAKRLITEVAKKLNIKEDLSSDEKIAETLANIQNKATDN